MRSCAAATLTPVNGTCAVHQNARFFVMGVAGILRACSRSPFDPTSAATWPVPGEPHGRLDTTSLGFATI